MEEKPVKQALSKQIEIDRLSLLKSRLEVAKAWCKKPHEAWKKWSAEYEIENFDDTAEIRDKVRIGYIFRKTENENASIFDDQPDLFMKGKLSDAEVIEEIYTAAYDYLWDKQNLEEKVEDVGVYFELLGMGFLDSPWVTKTKKVREMVDQPVIDETGQPIVDPMTQQPMSQPVEQEYEVPIYDLPKAKVKNPFKIYFSPETQFDYIMTSENCPYYFYEEPWIKERVKARFGKDVKATEKMHTGDSDADGKIGTEMEKQVDVVSDDLKRVTVYEYYGILPEHLARGITDSAGQAIEWEWDKEYHIFFTDETELLVEECPYSRYPLHIVGNYGLANKFFKFGDAKHLLPLVQELEVYRSLNLTHVRKVVNPKLLSEMGMEVDEDALRDPLPGRVVKYNSSNGAKPEWLTPPPLGQEVAIGTEQVRTDLEKTSPSFDLAGGGGQSQVRSPRGIATFSEAADKGSRRKRKKIARFIRQLIIFQLMQLGTNWKPEDGKTLTIGGKEEQVTPEVLQVLADPDLLEKLDIEIESLSVNRVQMREEAMTLWDIAVGAPNIFNISAVAKDLIQNGFNKRDADRYLISQDMQSTAAVQGFVQQLAQSNPELANAVMQYVQQPNMQQLQAEGAEKQMGQPAPEPPAPPTNGMPPIGEL